MESSSFSRLPESALVEFKSQIWTVPLSLVTHKPPPSLLNEIPNISAESVPLLNSFTKLDNDGFHTRTKVPVTEEVANRDPDGVVAREERELVWATMMETEGKGGAAGSWEGGGGSERADERRGGNRTICTCPICRPGKARSVEPSSVERATRPNLRSISELRVD
jgi:hypothetical protein